MLAVDDHDANLVALRTILGELPLDLDCVQSAAEGLSLLLRRNYALALIDVQMPGMDGFEMASLMRDHEETAQVPIIFVTAGGSSDIHVFRGYEAGAVDYLVKPYEPWMLVSKVRIFGDLYRQRMELTAALQERDRYLAQLREMAMVDSLTGLYNRRFFEEWIRKSIAHCERNGIALTLLAIDADHFKSVNDTYGHLVGDEVLIGIAKVMKSCIRDNDVCCRTGGEEFLAALVDCDEASSMPTAERIRLQIQAHEFHAAPGASFQVTTSIGAAQWKPGTSTDALIKAADDALYHAKQNGRNRVVRASQMDVPAPG